MTTLKTGSILTTGTAVGDTAPGMTLTFGATAVYAQAFQITDFINAPIFAVPRRFLEVLYCYGDYFGAANNLLKGVSIASDGKRNPGALRMTDGTSNGLHIWSGTGAPSATTVNGPVNVGDLYIRLDTPSTSSQRVYQCTAGGSVGTWAGRL
jgi:hypothetical protein